MRNVSDIIVKKEQILFSVTFRVLKNLAVHEIAWKNMVKPHRP
jgi:hypothetical protein